MSVSLFVSLFFSLSFSLSLFLSFSLSFLLSFSPLTICHPPPSSLPLSQAITAATKLGGDITCLVVGADSAAVAAEAAACSGVTSALSSSCPDYVGGENITSAILAAHTATPFTHILSPATNSGKSSIPRAAALLNASPVTDLLEILSEDTFVRPMYAGSALAKVQNTDAVKFLTIRPTAFDKAETTGGSGTVTDLPFEPSSVSPTFQSANVKKSDRPDLTAAGVVIAGGRGMKSGDNFTLLNTLADKLGGAVGASRAAVDAGFVPNDMQIGQTGKVVAPSLYIAVGISGAIQHLSGMKDSKTIVAINKDKEAPIFQVADYGLVEDLFEAVPEITGKV